MAAGIITQNTAPRLLLPSAITAMYGMEYELAAKNAVYSQLYTKMSSERAYEEYLQLVGIGPSSKIDEGGTIELDSYQQGYVRLSYHEAWGKRMRITKIAFEDNKHLAQAKVLSRELARASFLAREINGHALFNNSTSTSAPFLGSDGVAFLSTAHVLSKGGTLSNKPSIDGDISERAIESAMQAIWNWTDDAGNKIMIRAKSLFINRAQIFDAHRILESDLQVFTNDNTRNALKDLGTIPTVIPSVFLNSTTAWFILTEQPGLVFAERRAPEAISYNDDQTQDLVYGITERYVFDEYDPRCAYGSIGV